MSASVRAMQDRIRRDRALAIATLAIVCVSALAASIYAYLAWSGVVEAHAAGKVVADSEALGTALGQLRRGARTAITLWLVVLVLTTVLAILEWRARKNASL